MCDLFFVHFSNSSFSSRVFTDSIFYKRLFSADELMESVANLERDLLSKRPSIKLVIVDSIAYHFRYLDAVVVRNVTDERRRTSVLMKISQTLNRLAHEYGLAVVITNQMTTKFKAGEYLVILSGSFLSLQVEY
jgi:RecA/RadA recombinase